jgi:hypothetical protein
MHSKFCSSYSCCWVPCWHTLDCLCDPLCRSSNIPQDPQHDNKTSSSMTMLSLIRQCRKCCRIPYRVTTVALHPGRYIALSPWAGIQMHTRVAKMVCWFLVLCHRNCDAMLITLVASKAACLYGHLLTNVTNMSQRPCFRAL